MSTSSYTSAFSDRFLDEEGKEFKALIRRCADVSERAVRNIREGDLERTKLSLDVREMNIFFNEEYQRLKNNLDNFDEQLHAGRVRNAQVRHQRSTEAESLAAQALNSQIMAKEINILEKKVEVLRDSIVNLHKDYYHYGRTVSVSEVLEQVSEMAYRVERNERELGTHILNQTDPLLTPEIILKMAVEGLLGISSNKPETQELAKKLAQELRPFRDAAFNKNLLALVGIDDTTSADLRKSSSVPTKTMSSASTLSSRSLSEERKGSTAKYVSAGSSTDGTKTTSTSSFSQTDSQFSI
ncbi:unnamed protein product [Caenorhabditis auriculariae]|uniref:Uncharacterized protein n=1 Tax=Caenorhabditis auriculariae TaxID=2777116 RepID=A0A8S1HE42_9PELO|nr:unnamed protein product [Caenorhabditis auriculariae]